MGKHKLMLEALHGGRHRYLKVRESTGVGQQALARPRKGEHENGTFTCPGPVSKTPLIGSQVPTSLQRTGH